jgi:hypothetical protein
MKMAILFLPYKQGHTGKDACATGLLFSISVAMLQKISLNAIFDWI